MPELSVHGHEYNLKPSLLWVSRPDQRVAAHPFAAVTYPRRFIFGEQPALNLDQLQLGGCTANMIAAIIRFIMTLSATPERAFVLSRLWQYYYEREREGTVNSDSGATIADTVWVTKEMGFFSESLYQYNINIFTQRPPANLMAEADRNSNLINTTMLQSDVATQKAFMFNGDGTKPLPIAYGFAVYNQYESVGSSGDVAMPTGPMLGGHANWRHGWDDDHRNLDGSLGAWWAGNVWGENWGLGGDCWLPYSYPIWDVWGVAPKAFAPIPVPPQPTPDPTPTPGPARWISFDGSLVGKLHDDQGNDWIVDLPELHSRVP